MTDFFKKKAYPPLSVLMLRKVLSWLFIKQVHLVLDYGIVYHTVVLHNLFLAASLQGSDEPSGGS